MIELMLSAALVMFGLAGAIALIRIIIGPSLPDRIIALDMIGVILVSVVAVISVILNTRAFLEVILILAILAFISTIAFSRYIERGAIIERKRDR
ncbi:Na(+)/H(+) antiporter subunit F1 [Lentibacillus sediminis]|uniref:Na(+)/H(+) antiporter subunit F1 n=1 Tax=Lentibacillus sediminis TaxID=1940529 RepID=UPI000C1C4C16|nr:Na(+)/H(+) antiporter subunit F1 [Lentibacillus sediminis]